MPVALTAKSPFLIVARKDLPANTLQEFIAYAKEKPGEVTYASSGQGSLQQSAPSSCSSSPARR